MSTPPEKPSRVNLYNLYKRLVERAIGGKVAPPGGLTPRELTDIIFTAIDRNEFDPNEVGTMTALIERCVYEHQGTLSDIAHGSSLCHSITNSLPIPLSDTESQKTGLIARILYLLKSLREHTQLIVAFLLAGTLLALIGVAAQSGSSLFSAMRGVPNWSAAYNVESKALSVESDSTWTSAPSNPSYEAITLSPVFDPERYEEAPAPTMDLVTGVDGTYAPYTIFDPPLNSTHRLFVYTTIDSNYGFHRVTGTRRPATGPKPQPTAIYDAEFAVRFQPGEVVLIPAPSPDTVILSYRTKPRNVEVSFYRGPADDLFALSAYRGKVTLHYRVAARQDYSFEELPNTPFVSRPSSLPANVLQDAQVVISAIGQLPAPTYAQTVRRLHAYFSGFSVSPIDLSHQQKNKFLTVSLQRRGVCRHRARSFFVVSNALGIETRLVENRRHSFCEVRLPNGHWRRMEFRLGESEGPPSPQTSSWSGDMPPLVVSEVSMLGPFLLFTVLAFCLLAWMSIRRKTDLRGHLIQTASRDSSQSITHHHHREDHVNTSAGWLLTRKIILLVQSQIRSSHLSIDPDMMSSMECDCFNRIRQLNADSIDSTADFADLGHHYWDCYRIMHFFERMDHIDRATHRE